tara:strand:+ start:2458 stop:3120 length:663 start_codon:yes stop_codon:yes gene_type:complete
MVYQTMYTNSEESFSFPPTDTPSGGSIDATEIEEGTYKTCGEFEVELGNVGDNYQEVDVNGVKYCANCPVGYGLKFVNQNDISCQRINTCDYIARRHCYYTINDSDDSEGFDYFTYSNETDEFSPCVWLRSKELTDHIADDTAYVLNKRMGVRVCNPGCPNDPETGEERLKVTDNRTTPPRYMCVHHSRLSDFQNDFSQDATVDESIDDTSDTDALTGPL